MTLQDMSQSELAKSLHKDNTAPTLKTIGLNDFLQMKLPPEENILAPWLTTQSLSMIYAPRGIGKTHVALGIAYAVASGGEFLLWQASKPRGVLYLDGEMPANMMQERLKAITEMHAKPIAAPFEILTPDLQNNTMPDLSTSHGQSLVEPLLDNIELIIVDNIATLCRTGSENEAEAWKPVQDWSLRMRASKRAVLFIHHAGKKGAQRGSSAREDTLNTVIHLARPENYSPVDGAAFEIHFEKTRGIFGDAVRPFKAQLTKSPNGQSCWVANALDQNTYQNVVDKLNQGFSQKQIALELNLHKSTVSRHTNHAKQEGILA